MTIEGIRTRMAAEIVAHDGRLTRESLARVVELAREDGQVSAEEQEAIFDPIGYLRRDPDIQSLLEDRSTTLSVEGEAQEFAQALASELDYQQDVFPTFALISVPAPLPTDPAEALAQALTKGKDLGDYRSWNVKTSGANVKFASEVRGQGWSRTYPALVLDAPTWEDPESARELITDDRWHAFRRLRSIDAVKTFISGTDAVNGAAAEPGLLDQEATYLAADEVEVKSVNEQFGIQSLRRKALVSEVKSKLPALRLRRSERAKLGLFLVQLEEQMVSGNQYDMKVGSHENYWPYWSNYGDQLEQVRDQLAPGSDGYKQVNNRLLDIWRRKSVFRYNHRRRVDEKDIERSISAALVYLPRFEPTSGHRVSLAEESTVYRPQYELLSISAASLPEGEEGKAGWPVYRDAEGVLRFDYIGFPENLPEALREKAAALVDVLGQEVPESLVEHISIRTLGTRELNDLNFRPLLGNRSEVARPDISFDWDGFGGINVAALNIGWWGHCHNEAPLNAMGIDPQKDVVVYTEDRAIDESRAVQVFSAEDAWDVAGQFTADHEKGFKTLGRRGSLAQVDNTNFVGQRNNGANWLLLEFRDGETNNVRVESNISRLWELEGENLVEGEDEEDTSPREINEPGRLFQPNIRHEDGSFEQNPNWRYDVAVQDGDQVAIDAKGRKIIFETKYVTLAESNGLREEKKERIELDPAEDEFVKISEEVVDYDYRGGGEVVEHWYNPHTKHYYSVNQKIEKETLEEGDERDPESLSYERTELRKSDEVEAHRVISIVESEYESVKELHEFLLEKLGEPFVFDTEAGKPVWNYPVDRVAFTVEKSIDKEEDGKTFNYTSYHVKYSTMGGPVNRDVRYRIKRNEAGQVIALLADTPMPDFGFRNTHWVCAPIAMDRFGRPAYNVQALEEKYLLSEGGRSLDDIVPDLWSRQGLVLYASLSDETAADAAYIYIQRDGTLLSFDDVDTYRQAVESDQALREAESGEVEAAAEGALADDDSSAADRADSDSEAA